MSTLPRHFEEFHTRLTLDESRQSRAQKEHRDLRIRLENDDEIGGALWETFLQGSYAHHTLVKPKGDGNEFDVDVVASLDRRKAPSPHPTHVLNWLESRLARMDVYRNRLQRRPRCIRIDFPGDFHLDVVPCHCEARHRMDSVLEVPDGRANQWCDTHPKGLRKWYTAKNDESGGRFTRACKMFKEWRNEKLHHTTPSTLLEVALGTFGVPGLTSSSDAAYAASGFRHLAIWANAQRYPVRVRNPSLPDENLARDWSRTALDEFQKRVAAASNLAQTALEERNELRSAQLWRSLFGDRFPLHA